MRQIVFGIALVLTTASLTAQAPKSTAPKPASPATKSATPSATKPAASGYVPAIMQQRMTMLTGCLQHDQDYTLTNAAVARQGDVGAGGAAASSGGARAASGAKPAAATDAPASEASSAAAPAAVTAIPPALRLEGISPARLSILVGKRVEVTGAFQGDIKTTGKEMPRFEATAVVEATGNCSS